MCVFVRKHTHTHTEINVREKRKSCHIISKALAEMLTHFIFL